MALIFFEIEIIVRFMLCEFKRGNLWVQNRGYIQMSWHSLELKLKPGLGAVFELNARRDHDFASGKKFCAKILEC